MRVNDRGPFHDNRLIDLSYAAANRIGMNGKGTGLVEVRAVSSADDTAPSVATVDTGTAPSAAATPRLFLQVGAFANRSNAEQLRSRLTDNLIRNSLVQEASRPEGPIYRVRIGPLSGVEQADALTRASPPSGWAHHRWSSTESPLAVSQRSALLYNVSIYFLQQGTVQFGIDKTPFLQDFVTFYC